MKKILLVEDDALLSENVKSILTEELYSVQTALSLKEACNETNDFDLILLDWRLPDGRGIDYLKNLRLQNNTTPVIMLTSKSEIEDKVLGLELGANDYMTKPFDPKELLARVAVQLREVKAVKKSLYTYRDLKICTFSRTANYKKTKLNLTKIEFDLLKILIESQGKVFTRDELLNSVWGFDSFPTTRTVDMHVKQLRQKTSSDYIKTVHGIGYTLESASL